MTQFLYNDEQFNNWWYLRDKTHIVFYRPKTMEYIATKFKLDYKFPENTKNIVVFFAKE